MKLEKHHGKVNGSGNFMPGTVVTISVTPDEGYNFVQWEDGDTTNPRQVTVGNESMHFVALYEKIEEPAIEVIQEDVEEAPVEEAPVAEKPKKSNKKKVVAKQPEE